jgi:hypothetical protein
VDGTQLKYYNPMGTDLVGTTALLSAGNGQCSSWASLFLDVLHAQAVHTNYSNAGNPTYDGDYTTVIANSSYAQGFLVKDWNFPAAGITGMSGNSLFPYLNIAQYQPPPLAQLNPASPIVGNSYVWDYAQVVDQNGVAGQGSPTPDSIFENHQIIRVVTTHDGHTTASFYDPSYGKTYDTLADMEQKDIAGYYIVENKAFNEQTLGADLDGDGNVSNKNVMRLAMEIRPNDNGSHLDTDNNQTY